jgi:hypothetical protein
MGLHRLFTDHDTDAARRILRAIAQDAETKPEVRDTAIRSQPLIQPMMERDGLRPLISLLASAEDDPQTSTAYRGKARTWLTNLESWIARR